MNKIQVHGGVEEAAEMARDARFYTLSMLLSMWKASPSLILRQELIRQVTFCVENSPICVCIRISYRIIKQKWCMNGLRAPYLVKFGNHSLVSARSVGSIFISLSGL